MSTKTNGTTRPVQILSWAEKTEEWFKQNADYYITKSRFGQSPAPDSDTRDLDILYGVYNNKFPLTWFNTITNPLSASKEQHKKFPAKIRPVTILRTDIDLLLGEFPRRPFVYNVQNLGDGGYNRYMDGMAKTAQQNFTQHFMHAYLQEAQANGEQLSEEQLRQLQQDPPLPEDVKAQYKSSYKDNIAIKAQKFLRRQIREEEIRKKQHRMFKDWLIAGCAFSYKGIQNNKLVYKPIKAKNIAFEKSDSSIYVEDGEWVVHRDLYTLSDVVDQFYEQLKEKEHEKLENRTTYNTAQNFYSHLSSIVTDRDSQNKIPVYHVQWKGRKKIGFLSYMDMETFQLVEDIVDENYVIDREKGEQVEWRWVNEVYEVWRLLDDIYPIAQACPVQRNEMNNHSTCKLSYNGRNYSDTNAENISVLEMGLPFQILYIIITYTLEKTIAKSKGKILLIDQNAIPDDEEWDEEKFFYYSEAMGYALLNRNQIGVDKSWNQYQVVDMSLFDQIKQLIEMQQHLKQEWDDVIGISRQRKAQTMASDGQGVNERAIFQSTVITDMIFLGFEELCERDLQGIMDLGKFLTAKGLYGTFNDSDFNTELMAIMPEDFMNEELGVFLENASEELRKLQEMKQYAQAMLQNGHKGSTILEVIDAINIAELRQKLLQIEEIDAQIEQANAQSEQDAQQILEGMKEKYRELDSLLNIKETNAEYDRKEDIEYIKGSFNTFTFQDGDANDNEVPDALEVKKLMQKDSQMKLDYIDKLAARQQRNRELDMKEKELNHRMEHDKKKLAVDKQKVRVAAKKKATTSKK